MKYLQGQVKKYFGNVMFVVLNGKRYAQAEQEVQVVRIVLNRKNVRM